ncbi:MAG: hypothetical protein LBB45_04425 [Methanobrevibacter sp.]|nr:hypothetical protein [Candidatus Methanovirga basalitermitum]
MKKKELVCKKYGGYESYISYFYVCVSQGKKIKSIKLLSVPYIYLANIKISDYLREPQEYLKKIPEKYLDKYDEIIFPFIPQGSIFKEKDGIEYFLNGKASNGFRKTKTKISFNFESNDEEIKSNINKVLCGQ